MVDKVILAPGFVSGPLYTLGEELNSRYVGKSLDQARSQSGMREYPLSFHIKNNVSYICIYKSFPNI